MPDSERRQSCKECVSHLLVESDIGRIDNTAQKAEQKAQENSNRLGVHKGVGIGVSVFLGIVVTLMLVIINSSYSSCNESQKDFEETTKNRVDNILQTMRERDTVVITQLNEINKNLSMLQRDQAVLISEFSAYRIRAEKENESSNKRLTDLEKVRLREDR